MSKTHITCLIFLIIASNGLFAQGERTSINIISKEKFTPETNRILEEAIVLMDSVVNTATFRDKLLAARLEKTNGHSNAQILEMILQGREVKRPQADYVIDFTLETYSDDRGDNIGSTFNQERIVTSDKYISSRGARCYASHLLHEYCHTLGFSHPHSFLFFGRKRKKCRSVPYVVGNIVRELLGKDTCGAACESYSY